MPEYVLSIDPTNPGQFFACCGLFEAAELLANGTTAYFEDEGRRFILSTRAKLPPVRIELLPQSGDAAKHYEVTLEPLRVSIDDHAVTLSWWLNETHSEKSQFKTWGGQQTPRRVLAETIELLDSSVPVEGLLEYSQYTTTRFGVDARSAWDALDFGYSPNDEQTRTAKQALTYPWVEFLAVLGLQSFRPASRRDGDYQYAAWHLRLPWAVAIAACAAPWQGLTTTLFRFSIAGRGQGYKTFTFAKGANYD